jgi:hypothetical protein
MSADRLPGVWSSLTPHMHDRSALRVACLGVFDTVGALGIPFPQFKVFNRDTYEFMTSNCAPSLISTFMR